MLDNITIGDFDRRVTVQFRTISRDATYNQPIESWSVGQLTVWAKVVRVPMEKGENFEADQVRTMRRRTYMIRYSSDVANLKEEDRIVDDTEAYEISNITGGKRDGFWMLNTVYKDEAVTT